MDALYAVLIIALLAMLAGGLLTLRVQHTSPGGEVLRRLGSALRRAALPIAIRGALVLAGLAALFFLIFAVLPVFSLRLAFATLLGAAFTGGAALLAAHISIRAIPRTAGAASRGASFIARIALMGGGAGAFAAAGAALFGLAGLLMIFTHGAAAAALGKVLERDIIGFAFGAGAAALVFRCGGSITAQAASLALGRTGGASADKAGNPAAVAMSAAEVGAGTAGAVAEYTFVFSAALAAAVQLGLVALKSSLGASFPFLIAAFGTAASLLAAVYVLRVPSRKPLSVMRAGQLAATTLMLLAALFTTILAHLPIGMFIAVAIGAAAGCVCAVADDYYSSAKLWPARFAAASLAESSGQGILDALWLAARSTAVPIAAVAVAAVASFAFCGGFSEPAKGMFGLSLTALGALAAGAYRTAAGSAGCILLHARTLSAQSGATGESQAALAALQEDASGGACGSRGHSIAVSALSAFALFAAFTSAANLPALDMNQPLVLAGLLLGAAFPLLVAGAVVRSARLASQAVAVEVRRQFKEIPGLGEGQAEANYERCAEIGSARAMRSLASAFILLSAVPLLGLLAKLFKAWFYAKATATGGAEFMGSVIFGAAMSGLIIGLMAASIGGIIGGAGRQALPADSPAPSAEALSTSGLGAALASAAAPALAYAPLIIAAAALLCTQWLS